MSPELTEQEQIEECTALLAGDPIYLACRDLREDPRRTVLVVVPRARDIPRGLTRAERLLPGCARSERSVFLGGGGCLRIVSVGSNIVGLGVDVAYVPEELSGPYLREVEGRVCRGGRLERYRDL